MLVRLSRIQATVTLALTLAAGGTLQAGAQNTPTPLWHGIDTSGMDVSAKPTEDLFRFANGVWLDKTSIPSDRTSWGITEQMEEDNFVLLRGILEEAARDTKSGRDSVRRKVGDLFASGMDISRINAAGIDPIKPELALIDSVHDVASLQDAVAKLHEEGVYPCFWSGVSSNPKDARQMVFWMGTNDVEGGLGLPDRDYYLDTDDHTKEIRTAYQTHLQQMFGLLGESADQAKADAQTIVSMETRLAKVALDKVARRDPYATYHIMTRAEVDALSPGMGWSAFLNRIGLRGDTPVDVGNPAFVRELGTMMTSLPIENWKTYLRWNTVNTYASALSDPFHKEHFHFYSTVLNGIEEMQPRWKQVLSAVDGNIGEGLGKLYVERAFPPEAKRRALELVGNVKSALHHQLETSPWMAEATRKYALYKLQKMAVMIGYPDKWRNYGKLKIDRESYLDNLRRASEFEYRRELDKIGKPRDRHEWEMTPPTINAYYDPTLNVIVFPAGILQPPNFDPTVDDAVNYGNTGATIGHEITHGFDDQGRKYDADGNLKEWWTADDAKGFQARADYIVKQYDSYVAIDNIHVNGSLTLGENIADIGGLKIAYLAFLKSQEGKPAGPSIDGYTPQQRFFIAFAQSWREKRRPESLRLQLNTDPHSPEKFRVLGPCSLMPEYYQAFGQPVPDWVTQRQSQAIW